MEEGSETSESDCVDVFADRLTDLGVSLSTITAAHELKAPLALMRQLALALEGEQTAAVREQLCRQIVLTSERALRLTTDLSRAARLQDSLFELEPLNPRQICEEVAHEMAPLYRARGRELRVPQRHRTLLALAHRDLLRRVLLNFADNALQYTPEDVPVELLVNTRLQRSAIRVAVRDYGPAIPTNVWQRLQGSLGASAQPLHARPQSSGLGLLIAGQFARAMHGSVGATRHRNGATFYIDIGASAQLSLL